MIDANYPPNDFCYKMGRLLAPEGQLMEPETALNRYRSIDGNVEQKVMKAFAITVKKLVRLHQRCFVCQKSTENTFGGLRDQCESCHVTCCSHHCCGHMTTDHDIMCSSVANQLIDQLVECFPAPINIFSIITEDCQHKKYSEKELSNWQHWLVGQKAFQRAISKAARKILLWKEFAKICSPLYDGMNRNKVELSLQRLATGITSLPLTISHAISAFKLRSAREISLHLVGAGTFEITMVTSKLSYPIRSTLSHEDFPRIFLVSPDVNVEEMAKKATLDRPLIHEKCQISAYGGFYHDFHSKFVTNNGTSVTNFCIKRPDLIVCIHPGAHADDLFLTWRPTLELMIREKYPVAMTTYNQQEFEGTLEKLDSLGAKYLYKGENPFASLHVKQTPADKTLLWSVNSYLILFQGSKN